MMKFVAILLVGAAVAAPTFSREALMVDDVPLKGLECSACEAAVDKIETDEEPVIEKAIEDFADKLCTDIPGNLTTECDALVAQYLVPAIKALFAKANSTVVCQLAGLCPKTTFLHGAMECRLCQAGVASAETKIESNETITKIMTWADHACTIAPASLQPVCDSVLDGAVTKLMQALEADATPEVVCTDLGLCSKKDELSAADHDVARQAVVDAINSMEGVSWTAAIHPRFQGTPIGSVKSLCGVKPNSYEKVVFSTEKVEATGVSAPASFDSETNWPECKDVIGDIRDQSNCGCCWAFGAASAASDRMCIASKGAMKLPLSAQELCFCASDDGCDGGDLFTPWSFIQSKGLVTGGQYNGTGALGGQFCSAFSLPHCHHHGPQGNDPYPAEGAPGCPSESSPSCPRKCDGSAASPHNEFKEDRYSFDGLVQSYSDASAIQEAIMGQGPVEAAFTVYSDFENYAGGIYHHVSGSMAGGHAIRIVGWGEEGGVKYWKVANSWNPYWGEKGYFRIKRGNDECGIESQVTASSASATWSKHA